VAWVSLIRHGPGYLLTSNARPLPMEVKLTSVSHPTADENYINFQWPDIKPMEIMLTSIGPS
jgi:hypothetical protein